MINLLAGRRVKLLMTNAPLLSLSAWFFYRSSEWALWDESFEPGSLTVASVLLTVSLLTVMASSRMRAINKTEKTEQEEREEELREDIRPEQVPADISEPPLDTGEKRKQGTDQRSVPAGQVIAG